MGVSLWVLISVAKTGRKRWSLTSVAKHASSFWRSSTQIQRQQPLVSWLAECSRSTCMFPIAPWARWLPSLVCCLSNSYSFWVLGVLGPHVSPSTRACTSAPGPLDDRTFPYARVCYECKPISSSLIWRS